MRLWHYELIPYLPKSQLIAQWRELNSIYKNQPKHILINYVYDYPKWDLFSYSRMVIFELEKRNYNIKSMKNFDNYFGFMITNKDYIPFPNHHNDRYLIQCYFNLQEKYDRGQKDFTKQEMMKIQSLIRDEIGIPILEINK